MCDKCTCTSTCPNQGILKGTAEAHIVHSNSEYHLQSQSHTVNEDDREIFQSRLLDYRQSLLNDEGKQQALTHRDFTTGFSLHLIPLLVENMNYFKNILDHLWPISKPDTII